MVRAREDGRDGEKARGWKRIIREGGRRGREGREGERVRKREIKHRCYMSCIEPSALMMGRADTRLS